MLGATLRPFLPRRRALPLTLCHSLGFLRFFSVSVEEELRRDHVDRETYGLRVFVHTVFVHYVRMVFSPRGGAGIPNCQTCSSDPDCSFGCTWACVSFLVSGEVVHYTCHRGHKQRKFLNDLHFERSVRFRAGRITYETVVVIVGKRAPVSGTARIGLLLLVLHCRLQKPPLHSVHRVSLVCNTFLQSNMKV